MPALQGVHDAALSTSLYVPVAQLDGAVEPVAQYEPAGQSSQSSCAALPVAAE